jgi:prolyl oligopeptidase
MTKRPELFGACLPVVGVLDMLRFHKFTVGAFWVSDYGSPEDADMFPILMSYSPLHNVKEGAAYPPTLITTGDHDDRVFPAHSFKFAAALQHAQTGENPILIRIDERAGHGLGKPKSKLLDEIADNWIFAFAALNSKPNLT